MNVEQLHLISPVTRRWLAGIGLGGAATLCAGLFIAPVTAWTSLLVNAFFFLSIAMGATVFLALMYVANAGWSAALKRVPEGLAGYVPAGAATMLLVLAGAGTLYPWAHPAEAAALHDKTTFLNLPFFAARMVAILALWTLFARALRNRSRLQDEDGSPRHTERNVATSAVFLLVFALTFCLASFDWLMSLEPHWFSTIFGLYNIAGMLSASTCVIAVVTVLLKRAGRLPGVTANHLHDLGKLMFGFATLWAYMWLSQYLLIWYSNIPEETSYFLQRTQGGWSLLFWANLVLCWALPFFMLLPRSAKRSETNLLWAAGFLLAGRWLDLYLMAAPGNAAESPGLGVFDLAGALAIGALFILVVARALASAPLVARGDPYLAESLHLHT
ncbi:MAG: hypothetical protein ACYC8T_04490 [Myxococcaceae bacterium]